MMKGLVLLILLFFIFLGCSAPDRNYENYEVIRCIEVDVEYNYGPAFSGAFFDERDSITYLYIAEPKTRKNLKFFNLNGQIVDSLSLSPAINQLGNLGGISVLSRDTILILSLYNDRMAIIDRDGNLYKMLDYNDFIADSLVGFYTFYPPFLSCSNTDRNMVILHSSPDYAQILKQHELYGGTKMDKYIAYAKLSCNEPYLLKLSDYLTDDETVNFGLYNLYDGIYRENCIINDNPKFKILNGNIIVFSLYSDNLFLVDTANLKIKKQIEINSNYTTIGHNPLVIDYEVDIDKQIDKSIALKQTEGYITNVLYNLDANAYYVIVKHKLLKRNQDSFSVITLDQNFENQKECLFYDTKYNPFSAIMLEEGLLLGVKKGSYENKRNNKQIFEVISFN